MEEEKKIRITYQELSNPELDEVIKKYVKNSVVNHTELLQKHNSFIKNKKNRFWLYLLILAVIGLLLIWFLFAFFNQINSSKSNPEFIFSIVVEQSPISKIYIENAVHKKYL